MLDTNRDSKGRYMKGRIVPSEENKRKVEAMKRYYEAKGTLVKIKTECPRIFNSWRSILYTEKGRRIGCSNEWKDFEVFYNDVFPTYKPGLILHRIDTSLPFSKENFIWVTKEQAAEMNDHNIIYLKFKGEELSLREASIKYNQSLSAIKLRYHRHKDDYTTEEIIFGRKIKRGSKTPRNALNSKDERAKASKLISSYKCKDKRQGHTICNIDIEWMITNIFHKPCIYCGDTSIIGCDRVDNNKGHTTDNVVPCCVTCNMARNRNFTFDEMLILGKTIQQIKANRLK